MTQSARHIFSSSRATSVAAGICACRRAGLPSPAEYAPASICASEESDVSTLVASLAGGRDARPLRQAGMPAATAFSLIEVLIAVTLMSVIVLGLMAMFGETQRAFRTGINQVDIMEGGRSAMDLIAREVEQAVATDMRGEINFSVRDFAFRGSPQLGAAPFSPYFLRQELPGTGEQRTNVLQDILFASREGQQWFGIGYAVIYTNYLGSLYRYETNFSAVLPNWEKCAAIAHFEFMQNGNPAAVRYSKVLDNVVHFRARTYDSLGRLLSPDWNYKTPYKGLLDFSVARNPVGWESIRAEFYSNAIPAYVEIELGVLDTKIAGRARTLGEDSLNAQRQYLEKQAGSVQIFRRRVPIRNVDPSVYQ